MHNKIDVEWLLTRRTIKALPYSAQTPCSSQNRDPNNKE